ncbi:MAG TPA: glycoside hydrolase family 15 protein [Candidatus Saccharimonadales bacterium]|nr:glycoside hydrolase family 15 protein [Candidatus Saccharimonadales bacterium]
MGRPVVLSNGQLFVGLDEDGLVHDFYYPYVGLDNLTNARSIPHKIGVWVDGKFSWTDDGTWDIKTDFEVKALVSKLEFTSTQLGVTLEFQDFIDITYNAFIRRAKVTNLSTKKRDIRLFMHQVFEISRSGRGDTALYVPDDHYLLDYKGRCCLLIAGKMDGKRDFDQYAVGIYGIESKLGTFKDAEDGELSNNPVEHGGVDSVLRFRHETEAQGSFNVDYWIVAANSQYDAQVAHTYLKHYDLDQRQRQVEEFWQQWLAPALQRTQHLPAEHRNPLLKSLLIIKAHCDDRGSILASGDSSIFNYGRDYYCYCWPRDSAYAVWPLIRLGIFDEAKSFFDFARDTMSRDGYLMHKYQPDRAIGSTWHPLVHNRRKELAIQEDETASVIFMFHEYVKASGDTVMLANYYDNFIYPAAHFMTHFVDRATGLPHASYDLWEEKFLTTTYTVCTVIAGLEAAAKLAEMSDHAEDAAEWRQTAEGYRSHLDALYNDNGYFFKGFLLNEDGNIDIDDTLDISNLYGPFMFAGLALDDPRMKSTFDSVCKRLLDSSPIGGVIRYEHDSYFLDKKKFKGNPWIVCTLWLAQYLFTVKRDDEAKKLLDWALERALPSGVLSEQYEPETGEPLSVAPLVWSHAELVNTILDLHKL